MRINSVESYALSSPIEPPQDRHFHGGTRRLQKRDMVLVVVETAEGERGVAPAGASSSAMREYFEDESQGTLADVLASEVAPAIEGEEVGGTDDVHRRIDALDLPARLRTEAISVLDIALYDIRGKRAGVPVFELLADEFENPSTPTTELPLYASAGMYMEPDGYAEQATLLENAGFIGYKYRPGIGPEGDRRTIDLVTDSVDRMEVMLDAHTWWELRNPYGDA